MLQDLAVEREPPVGPDAVRPVRPARAPDRRAARRAARAAMGRRRLRWRGAPHPADGAEDRGAGHRLPAAEDAAVPSGHRPVAGRGRGAPRPSSPAGRIATTGGAGLPRPRPRLATGIGTPIEPGNLRRSWLTDHAGGRSAGPSHPRPSACPRLAHARPRVRPKVVSERLGHASVNITLTPTRTCCPASRKPPPRRSTRSSPSRLAAEAR